MTAQTLPLDPTVQIVPPAAHGAGHIAAAVDHAIYFAVLALGALTPLALGLYGVLSR